MLIADEGRRVLQCHFEIFEELLLRSVLEKERLLCVCVMLFVATKHQLVVYS